MILNCVCVINVDLICVFDILLMFYTAAHSQKTNSTTNNSHCEVAFAPETVGMYSTVSSLDQSSMFMCLQQLLAYL